MNILGIQNCLAEAVKKFNQLDKDSLLCPGIKNGAAAKKGSPRWGAASERAIAHRIAVYLEDGIKSLREQNKIPDDVIISVDCEYNRHLRDEKIHRIPKKLKYIVKKAKRKVRRTTDDDASYVFSVAPDIVIHQRNEDRWNILVIEIKKATNPEIKKYDDLKLRCFTDPDKGYEYNLGAFLIAEDDASPDQRTLRIAAFYAGGKESESQSSDLNTVVS